jgi:hypothetical protein
MTTRLSTQERRAGVLTDHRGFERASVWFIAAATLVLAGILILTRHGDAAAGVVVGAGLACVDARMLARSLTRFDERSDALNANNLTIMMMARFFLVALTAGLLVSEGHVSALGVVIGLLLFPVGVVTVALRALSVERGQDNQGAHHAG